MSGEVEALRRRMVTDMQISAACKFQRGPVRLAPTGKPNEHMLRPDPAPRDRRGELLRSVSHRAMFVALCGGPL